ncbi:MAG: UDP-N-acetylmuramoyl-L-alanyl-D-glutamate--2,6-diaminopimelate ligase [Rickettsiales bacterium]|nr:UDP-N-acetylmuramoyl-L-alanyl-D-glutamate--2,6-diaminopimelate ligase [Rickettsiales bacterium]
MKLSQILSQVKTDFKTSLSQSKLDSIIVDDIALDSRLVKKNSIFFALSGKSKDGLEFAASAITNGANVVIAEVGKINSAQFNLIESTNPLALLVEFLQIFYAPLPANIYAITGTNGKTSTAEFTRQILQFLGKKSASIGTLGIICETNIEDHLQQSSLTTSDIVSTYKNLHILKKYDVDDVAIEVSSIGLDQSRVAGLKIAVGAFTNFTQDHLDYHKSMAEYFRCKMLLFSRYLPNKAVAVLNSDLAEFSQIKKICQERDISILEYGFKAAHLRLKKIVQSNLGQKVFFQFQEKDYYFELQVSGDFQAFNALCALGNILAKNNLSASELENLLKNFSLLLPALGRMQRVATLPNQAQIFIDFAHTPDALKNVLQLARQITKKRVIILFGCGGNRDAQKRSIMGKIASELADLIIITDDNPRFEDANLIRQEILKSCDHKKTIEIADRKTAIEKTIAMLEGEDVLILAGKGHEKYQIIAEKKFEFDEEKIVRNVVNSSS